MSELRFGLPAHTISAIQNVFARHPAVQQVVLYGSRAKGNYRPGSDIDLSILGDGVSLSELFSLESELDDLLLPYKIDLSLYRQIDNPELLEHIQRVGVPFYPQGKS